MLSFAVNKDLVAEPPADWADLLKPEYANAVALAGRPARLEPGDPRRLCRRPRRRRRGRAATPAKKGLDFFAELNKAGNFVPVIGKSGTLAQGATPIVIWWDYNALCRPRHAATATRRSRWWCRSRASSPASTSRRSRAFAPHPNAAKLWMEYLYSDEGQLKWLEGYCHPIRFNDAGRRAA